MVDTRSGKNTGGIIDKVFRKTKKRAGFLWRLDETYVKIKEQVVRLLTA